jgi:hypothetical protein
MQNLPSVYFAKHLFKFRAYLQPIHTVYLLTMGCRYPRNMYGFWQNILKINCASIWLSFKWIYRDAARSTKHKTHFQQTKLFISVTPLLAHQVLDNVSLLLNQILCFTGLDTYFLLVVHSLYKELKGTATPYNGWRVRLNNNLYERKC